MAYKYTYKKYMGDDRYSWAVFQDGRVVTTGMDRIQAKYLKEKLEREQAAKRMVAELGPVKYVGKV